MGKRVQTIFKIIAILFIDSKSENYFRFANFYFSAAFFNGTTDRRGGSLSLWDFGRKMFGASPARMNVRIGINHEFITVADPDRRESLLVQRITDCLWMKIVHE